MKECEKGLFMAIRSLVLLIALIPYLASLLLAHASISHTQIRVLGCRLTFFFVARLLLTNGKQTNGSSRCDVKIREDNSVRESI